jgi:hypothetical protein
MTPRKRLLALVLLAGVVAVSSALAGRSDTGFTVTSTLDGKTVLPVRIQWIATPQNAQNVSEVDYFIDGYHAWTEHNAPYQYASDGDWLVTTFLKPGQVHTFTVRATTTDNQVATDTVKAQVVAPPRPPAKLRGIWTLKKAAHVQRPPVKTFTITPKGWVFGPNLLLDAQYLPSGNVVLGTVIINRPEQTDAVCNGQPPLHKWHVAFSADGKTMQLNPIGTDPCRTRLAAVQGTWTRGR